MASSKASASKAPQAPKKASSAVKRTRQGDLRHARNTSVLSRLKTEEKKILKAIEGEVESVGESFSMLTSMLDKAVKQGVLHKNTAARKKSIFNKRVVAGKSSVAKPAVRPKAPKGQSAKEKSKAKAKVNAKAKK
ncbi:MAG: 30S ribosomal protein S20 [Verrucomicrobia bacterium RIFCSPHIGHO2_12_FULL_41_10]|nr:MAG: 30S ribosomal protein S20 [Verrucomicrobia bacterium RIFCSPHIGHO2_12_FULL_41_10]HLB33350.1 30S ribosomal protein S20 [Chthoniobacterales bacterium]